MGMLVWMAYFTSFCSWVTPLTPSLLHRVFSAGYAMLLVSSLAVFICIPLVPKVLTAPNRPK